MPIQYILKNCLRAEHVEGTEATIHVKGQPINRTLTEDMRGGVYGSGYDVEQIKCSDMLQFASYQSFLDDDMGREAAHLARVLQSPGRIEVKYPVLSELQHDVIYKTNPEGEKEMAFTTVDYYNDQDVNTIDDTGVFHAVIELEAELKGLKKLNQKSKAVRFHQKRLRRDIKKLMQTVDGRHK